MKSRRLITPLALTALALWLGCGGKPDKSDDANAQIAQIQKKLGTPVDTSAASGAETSGDPCSLLDPNEVAAAIGPLAAPPFRGDFRPEEDASKCRYETADHRRLTIDVDWSGGAMAMKMIGFARKLTDQVTKQGEMKIGATVLSTGDTVTGSWDQVAEGPMSCCDLHALRGDRHIEMDWSGTRLTTAQAARLLDAAVKRLDHPLNINGNAGVAAGEQLFAADARDSTADMCALVPQATAEAALGAKLAGPPQRGQDPGAAGARTCTYRLATPPDVPVQEFDVTLWSWRDGAVEFASDQHVLGMAGTAMRRQLTGANTPPPVDTTAHPAGPWDEAGYSTSPGYEAVKGPLLVRVSGSGKRAQVLALLASAVTALGATTTH